MIASNRDEMFQVSHATLCGESLMNVCMLCQKQHANGVQTADPENIFGPLPKIRCSRIYLTLLLSFFQYFYDSFVTLFRNQH